MFVNNGKSLIRSFQNRSGLLLCLLLAWVHMARADRAEHEFLSIIDCSEVEFQLSYVPYDEEILHAYDVSGHCEDYALKFRELFVVHPQGNTANYSFRLFCTASDPTGSYIGSGLTRTVTIVDSAFFHGGDKVCMMIATGAYSPSIGMVSGLQIKP